MSLINQGFATQSLSTNQHKQIILTKVKHSLWVIRFTTLSIQKISSKSSFAAKLMNFGFSIQTSKNVTQMKTFSFVLKLVIKSAR